MQFASGVVVGHNIHKHSQKSRYTARLSMHACSDELLEYLATANLDHENVHKLVARLKQAVLDQESD